MFLVALNNHYFLYITYLDFARTELDQRQPLLTEAYFLIFWKIISTLLRLIMRDHLKQKFCLTFCICIHELHNYYEVSRQKTTVFKRKKSVVGHSIFSQNSVSALLAIFHKIRKMKTWVNCHQNKRRTFIEPMGMKN